jgi:hypothetical protein
MAWSKDVVVTRTIKDYISKEDFAYAEYDGRDGHHHLVTAWNENDTGLASLIISDYLDGCNIWHWVTTDGAGYSGEHSLSLDCFSRDHYDTKAKYDAFMKDYIVMPLYLYRHSGDFISLGSFNDPWDSAMMGLAYASKSDICKEFNCKRIGKQIKSKAINILKSQINNINAIINGALYGITHFDLDTDERYDCGGFIYHDDDALAIDMFNQSCYPLSIETFKELIVRK